MSMSKEDIRDKYYLMKNQRKIHLDCIKKGYSILKMPSGKIYKIKELG